MDTTFRIDNPSTRKLGSFFLNRSTCTFAILHSWITSGNLSRVGVDLNLHLVYSRRTSIVGAHDLTLVLMHYSEGFSLGSSYRRGESRSR